MTTAHTGASDHRSRWVDTNRAAAIVCCHPEVLRRWHRTGSAPFALPKPKRRGRQYLWSVDALYEAMEAMRTEDGTSGDG
ncbi:hypothetical protein [Nocardia sp. NPDC057030]|uniref:hypothetical protein n=1 Tax=unclassified Nocardia TaxID=2637762 RepID=UPI00363C755C